jgi:capsular exopolysaccharide synthesis family protein
MLPWGGSRTEGRTEGWHRIDKVHPTGKALADSFGALRTAVLFTAGDEPLPRTILVTSCRAAEGKTTVSVNFAMSLAQLGHRVLLVDADLRRPSVHRAFRIPALPGVVNCLTNGIHWKDAVQTLSPSLDVLSSGGATSKAGDMVSSPRFAGMLREAELAYDYVIVDAPALFINAADARVLAQLVDGVIVVVRSRATPRALVDRIPTAVPNVIGMVVNDLRKDSLPGYYSDYFAEYGEDEGERPDTPAGQRRPNRYAARPAGAHDVSNSS